jgi:hypothetical protein
MVEMEKKRITKSKVTNEVSRPSTKRGATTEVDATRSTRATSGTIAQGILVKYPSGFRNGFNAIPHYPSEIKKLAKEFLQWAYDSDTTNLNEFPLSKSLCPYKFKRIKEEYFQECYLIASLIVAARVDKKWKNGEIDRVYASQKLTMYDEDYKNMIMERYKQLASGNSPTTLNITMEKYPSCPEVPEKK